MICLDFGHKTLLLQYPPWQNRIGSLEVLNTPLAAATAGCNENVHQHTPTEVADHFDNRLTRSIYHLSLFLSLAQRQESLAANSAPTHTHSRGLWLEMLSAERHFHSVLVAKGGSANPHGQDRDDDWWIPKTENSLAGWHFIWNLKSWVSKKTCSFILVIHSQSIDSSPLQSHKTTNPVTPPLWTPRQASARHFWLWSLPGSAGTAFAVRSWRYEIPQNE